MIGRADIEGSKSNVAMNAWLPQASSLIPTSTWHFLQASTVPESRRTVLRLHSSILSDGGSTYLKPREHEFALALLTLKTHTYACVESDKRALSCECTRPSRLRIDPTDWIVTRACLALHAEVLPSALGTSRLAGVSRIPVCRRRAHSTDYMRSRLETVGVTVPGTIVRYS